MKKNKKAISPIVATLLLIAIAVAAAAVFYFFVQDIIAARGKGDITDVNVINFNRIRTKVENIGYGDIELETWSIQDKDGNPIVTDVTEFNDTSQNPLTDLTIEPGSSITVDLEWSGTSMISGSVYRVIIKFDDGTYAAQEFTA